mmetsp:Transcript_19925/g.43312  ORF Transcript_19925/g.43312 Transcript_19925/m.43312 type:complete len:215 (-) Transcript_19925:582-1226(-)
MRDPAGDEALGGIPIFGIAALFIRVVTCRGAGAPFIRADKGRFVTSSPPDGTLAIGATGGAVGGMSAPELFELLRSLRSTLVASSLLRRRVSGLIGRAGGKDRGTSGPRARNGESRFARSLRSRSNGLYLRSDATKSTPASEAPDACSEPQAWADAFGRPDTSMSFAASGQAASGVPSSPQMRNSMSLVSVPGNRGLRRNSSAMTQPADHRSTD